MQLSLDKLFPYGSMDIHIFCDGSGGSDGHSGGYGFVAKSTHGNVLAEGYGKSTGNVLSNNVSEYLSVINALEWSKGKTAGQITIKTDSLLVVQQVTRQWKCKKEHLKPLQEKARALLIEVDANIVWIPRAENEDADALSRKWETDG
jgi:ribonuclease HI